MCNQGLTPSTDFRLRRFACVNGYGSVTGLRFSASAESRLDE
jgi:hypothetical protein